MKKHIIVCYRGGYGGDFLAGLISAAIGDEKALKKDDRTGDRNRFKFDNYSLYGHHFKNIHDVVGFRNEYGYQEEVIKVKKMKEYDDTEAYFNHHFKVFNECNDEDERVFFDNILNVISSFNSKADYVVTNLHYFKPINGFSIWNLKHSIVPFILTSSKENYHLLLSLLGVYKTSWIFVKGMSRSSMNQFLKPQPIIPFDNMHAIDVGKLFLEDGYEEEVDSILSRHIGLKISIDKSTLSRYKRKNDDILKKLLGDDYLSLPIHMLQAKLYELYLEKL